MGIFDKVRGWFGRPAATEQRYDNVRIVNLADGTSIQGHDAVKKQFEKEKQLHEEHGASIIFQVYRIDVTADSVAAMQGERLAELKVGGDFVAGTDTVASVKAKLRPLLEEASRSTLNPGAHPRLRFGDADRITVVFNGRPMRDGKLFYADHFMLLPCWVQVCVHECESDVFLATWLKLGTRG